MAVGADPSSAAGCGAPTEPLGDLEGPIAVVDRAGTITVLDADWGVGWAVSAGDRWHVAAHEAAVRTRLVDGMPVVATAMRVPGGDVVQRAAATRRGRGRGVVLEFVNETAGPVSLALAVSGSISKVQVRSSHLMADGSVALELDRAPGGAVAVSDGDVWTAVRSGPPAGDVAARSRSGLAAAAVVVPLAAGVPLWVTVPVSSEPVEARSPGRVAAGWLAVVSRGASLAMPDETAERAWQRGMATCILAAGGADIVTASRAAVVLDRVGLADEADRSREMILRALAGPRLSPVDAVAGLRALASRQLRGRRVSGLAEWAGPLVDAAGDRLDAFTVEQVASALEPEAPDAARDARSLFTGTASPVPASSPVSSRGDLGEIVRLSAAFGGDGLVGIEALLDCLVAETPDQILIAPALPRAWLGASVDAQSLETRHGRLSFSVRWHGIRPALLWELVPPTQRLSSLVALRCGLDESWTTSEPSGEALLNQAQPERRE